MKSIFLNHDAGAVLHDTGITMAIDIDFTHSAYNIAMPYRLLISLNYGEKQMMMLSNICQETPMRYLNPSPEQIHAFIHKIYL